MKLSWLPSTDVELRGYHVYRADSPSGPFARLTTIAGLQTTFSDSPPPGTNTYMVRAVKLERVRAVGTVSLNLSQGIFVPASVRLMFLPPRRNDGDPARQENATKCKCAFWAGRDNGFQVDASPDLRSWKTLTTNVLGTNGFTI